MSDVTDVEVSRALNALVTTLNDQHPAIGDAHRWQGIVTGSLGGEARILVRPEAQDPPCAVLVDRAGRAVARFRREGERWRGERVGGPLHAYVPR